MANEKATAAAPVQQQADNSAKRYPAKVVSLVGTPQPKSNGKMYQRFVLDITAPSGKTIRTFADRNMHRSDAEGNLIKNVDTETGEETLVETVQPVLGQDVNAIVSVVPDNVTGQPRPFWSVSLGIDIASVEEQMAAFDL